MSDETQDTIISFLKERLDKMEIKNETAIEKLTEIVCTKRDLDRVIESHNRRIQMLAVVDAEGRIDIDNHCIRIRELEKQKAIQDSEFKPIKKLFDSIVLAAIGFVILVGTLAVGFAYYWKSKFGI